MCAGVGCAVQPAWTILQRACFGNSGWNYRALGHTSQRYGGRRSRRWMRWPASLAVSPAARLPDCQSTQKAPMATEEKRKLALWARCTARYNWWVLSLQRCQRSASPHQTPTPMPPSGNNLTNVARAHFLPHNPLRLGTPISSPIRLSRFSSKSELLKLISLFNLNIGTANMQQLLTYMFNWVVICTSAHLHRDATSPTSPTHQALL